MSVNDVQRQAVVDELLRQLKTLRGSRICLLGLAFKPGTDDLRDSPALDVAFRLVERGAFVTAYDPMVTVVPDGHDMRIVPDPHQAATGADAVVVATEWPQFLALDMASLAKVMRGDVFYDCRNVFDPEAVARAGLRYVGIGRPSVRRPVTSALDTPAADAARQLQGPRASVVPVAADRAGLLGVLTVHVDRSGDGSERERGTTDGRGAARAPPVDPRARAALPLHRLRHAHVAGVVGEGGALSPLPTVAGAVRHLDDGRHPGRRRTARPLPGRPDPDRRAGADPDPGGHQRSAERRSRRGLRRVRRRRMAVDAGGRQAQRRSRRRRGGDRRRRRVGRQ